MASDIVAINTTDKCVLLAVKDAYVRPGNFTDWNEVRMAMFWTMVPAAGTDAACTAEALSYVNYKSFVAFGLKDASTHPPGEAGGQFIGILGPESGGITSALFSNSSGSGSIGNSANTLAPSFSAWNGATKLATTYPGNYAVLPFPIWNASSYNGFLALKFVVANKGGATQTITVTWASGTGPYADVSANNLRVLMETGTYGGGGSLTWNASGAALPLPCNFYMRVPYVNNRLRSSVQDLEVIS
jgi:hypothetical protein